MEYIWNFYKKMLFLICRMGIVSFKPFDKESIEEDYNMLSFFFGQVSNFASAFKDVILGVLGGLF